MSPGAVQRVSQGTPLPPALGSFQTCVCSITAANASLGWGQDSSLLSRQLTLVYSRGAIRNAGRLNILSLL